VSRLRVAGASALLVGAGVGLIVLAAGLGSKGVAGIAAFVIGLVLVPLLASALEWLVHRCVSHVPVVSALRPIFTVHTALRYTSSPTWRYVTSGPPRRLAISAEGAPEVHES